jgi:GntR family transcriptional repressor for pyruvate dehydrogenase complex
MLHHDISNIRPPHNNDRGAAALLRFIEGSIAGGVWKPGDQLPTERELGVRFGLARNTLRKRLKVLESEGLIVRRVGSGSFVAQPPRPIADVANPGLALLTRIHGASPAEVMELRLMIEPQVIDLAVARATTANFNTLNECLERGEAAQTIPEFEMRDGLLHLEILKAARNQLLIDIYDALNGVRRQAQWGKLKERTLTPEGRILYEKQHRDIVTALKARDAAMAREALVSHLKAVREALLGAM